MDKIISDLMAKKASEIAAMYPLGVKRPSSPPQEAVPAKKHLPETLPPSFNVDLFAAFAGAAASTDENFSETSDALTSSSSSASSSWMPPGIPGGASLSSPSPSSSALAAALSVPVKKESPEGDDESPSDSESDHATNDESAHSNADSLITFMNNVGRHGGLIRDEDAFCMVPGRLSLLSAGSKYTVSIGEIRRRLSPPESLNASLLGGILRRAKSKNGGRILRDAINKLGMELPIGRRKSIRMTLFNSLVEGEALQLAKDFQSVCQRELPAKLMGNLAAARKQAEGIENNEREQRLTQINAAKDLLVEMHSLLGRPNVSARTPTGESAVDEGLATFDIATHYFGVPTIQAGLECFARFLEGYRQCLENTGSPAPQPAPSSAPLHIKQELPHVQIKQELPHPHSLSPAPPPLPPPTATPSRRRSQPLHISTPITTHQATVPRSPRQEPLSAAQSVPSIPALPPSLPDLNPSSLHPMLQLQLALFLMSQQHQQQVQQQTK